MKIHQSRPDILLIGKLFIRNGENNNSVFISELEELTTITLSLLNKIHDIYFSSPFLHIHKIKKCFFEYYKLNTV